MGRPRADSAALASADPVSALLHSETDALDFGCIAGESVLLAALRAGLPMAHACGGKARCSTCRIWIDADCESAPPATGAEAALCGRLGFGPQIRLACQLRPSGPLRFRRLVIDAEDMAIANQLGRAGPAPAGEVRDVTVLFFDVEDFTAASHRMPPYDVMFLLNKFLGNANRVLERFGGYFDKAVGDGFMAIFGVRGRADAPLRAVAAAVELLAAVDRARPLLQELYGIRFDARIGLHHGEALVGALGPGPANRLTVIGDVANLASRVEQANKLAGTRLLVTEEVFAATRDLIVSPDFVRTRMAGVEGRRTLYEVTDLTDAGRARLAASGDEALFDLPGRSWEPLLASDDLPEGALRIVPQPHFDVVLTRRAGRVLAFNNHCPHNRLPFFGSEITAESGLPPVPADSPLQDGPCRVVCRFHGSVFSLETGEIKLWCPDLEQDGSPHGLPVLGDLSKNEAPLEVFPAFERDGTIWVALP